MKKLLMPFLILLILTLAACNSDESSNTDANSNNDKNETDTITYESEEGPIEVPANPKRVVVVSTYAGNVASLGVNIVGVDAWAKSNPQFNEYFADVEEISEENLEKIIELDPDLIIGLSTAQNLDKLKEIAPTVTFTYGKVDYLEQQLEIGKLLNKEKEAQEWIDDFKERAQKAGEEIKAKIGDDATVSVIENFDKQIYVFGDNWGRGTEILYQEMNLAMPKKVQEMALKDGYYALSLEVLPEYAGDYIIFSKVSTQDNSFQETDVYKNIPAVKNGRVFEANAEEFYFNDPISLDNQLEFFKEQFLNSK
ncbi:iron-hydroxamate ABC transporter substrate-binding protein [Psychrobacillus sp. Sa2BUA9]|uniref:Iron-hydroxamate ABC transporter substrate-binding protein n=1 Tax=Psychrobacillus faecigallinarum TaxID=2762235 RepID=A0ABR8R8F0_9BACI|nr:iron-hydroxamate ABC transporter substrate-binding protein [Psychrobacillus faecigallinarum]MBD7944068.1 iron-hydroxamate ABC transporter substrate-binding protein [Psychrobacillus faecigallinarum]